jgi:hypothetical protein
MGRFQAEKLLNMKGTKVRCEITRGTKMVCTYWEPVRAHILLVVSRSHILRPSSRAYRIAMVYITVSHH